MGLLCALYIKIKLLTVLLKNIIPVYQKTLNQPPTHVTKEGWEVMDDTCHIKYGSLVKNAFYSIEKFLSAGHNDVGV
jgi:hypothetical protein